MTTTAARHRHTAHRMRLRDVAVRVGGRLALLALAAVIGLLVVVPRVTHGAALTVLSGSMTPDLPVGSVVLVRPVDTATLRPGDIITFTQPRTGTLVTHRIVGIDRSTSPAGFIVRGDANPVADPQPVPAAAVRGKVWLDVPYLGTVRAALGHGRGVLVPVGVVLLSAFSLWQLAGAWRDRRVRT